MINIITEKNDQLEKFFNKEECTRIVEQLGKSVWIVTDLINGEWNGVLLYSFMYSTWTRYNPFILYASGDNILDMVRFLRQTYPGLPIRGYMIENDQIMTQAKPVDLTKSEDWVWLRLEDLTDFEKCKQKGVNRSKSLNLEMTIKTAEVDDFDEIQKMIEELAVYENMLDQCQMTAEKLKEDYTKSPTLYAPKYYATVARLGSTVIGYTVSIDFFTLKNGKETYLEDLFIREEYRRKGLGSQLLHSVWSESTKRNSNGYTGSVSAGTKVQWIFTTHLVPLISLLLLFDLNRTRNTEIRLEIG